MQGSKWLTAACICLIAILWIAYGNAQQAKPEQKDEPPRLVGKNVAMIIAFRNYRDEELERPRELLRKEGAEVDVYSSHQGEAHGMLGGKIRVNKLVTELKPERYDAVVFIGGSGAQEYWNNPTAHAIARKALEQGKIVAAICIAPVTLAKAGVLKGRRATVLPSAGNQLKAAGAKYTGKAVETDGRIVTANGPQSASMFAQALVKLLAEKQAKEKEPEEKGTVENK